MKNIPFGAMSLAGYADKLAGGLQQLMAGARKFNLHERDRTDTISARRKKEGITKIQFMADVLNEGAIAILRDKYLSFKILGITQ